jgi:hypothetical protein
MRGRVGGGGGVSVVGDVGFKHIETSGADSQRVRRSESSRRGPSSRMSCGALELHLLMVQPLCPHCCFQVHAGGGGVAGGGELLEKRKTDRFF